MFLPFIYKEWNRRRGHGEKTLGIAVLMGSWLVYLGLAHFPLGGSIIQFGFISGAVVLGWLICFQWIWGSKYWAHHDDSQIDTRNEKPSNFVNKFIFDKAEKYASSKYEYYSREWLVRAFAYINVFKFTVAFSLVGIACLNPLIPLLGLACGHISNIYKDAMDYNDDSIGERAETSTGLFLGYLVLTSVVLHATCLYFKPLILGLF